MEELREYVQAEDGILTWKKVNKFNPYMLGKEIGTINDRGYLTFSFNNKLYSVHRVIYFLETGEIPQKLRHKDGNKLNNKFSNLATYHGRVSRPNKCGHPGVSEKNGLFRAQISYKGEREDLGLFRTVEEASNAYKIRHKEIHGENSIYQDEYDIPSPCKSRGTSKAGDGYKAEKMINGERFYLGVWDTEEEANAKYEAFDGGATLDAEVIAEMHKLFTLKGDKIYWGKRCIDEYKDGVRLLGKRIPFREVYRNW